MKKIILIAIALISSQYTCNAQQQPQFTHYMYNTIAVNPGYTGSRDALAINAVNRNQWVGFDDDVPRTTTLSVHSPLRNENMGIGLSVMHDQSGYENFSYVYADYSYTLKMKENHHLAFGVKAGFSQYKIDPELFMYEDVANDPYFQDKLNRWTPNVGIGMYYHTNKWYAGLSSPRIINNDYNKNSEYVALEQNHYYLIGGYVFDMTPNTKFRPSFSTKYTSGAPLSIEASAIFLFYEKFWLGASYRVDDAIGALFDFKLNKQFRIGYAFEYPMTDIAKYTSGTHEVMLIYEFKYNFSRYKSPRYF